jgi:hypothetical protein
MGDGSCNKCRCNAFVSSDPAMMTNVIYEAPAIIRGSSRKCFCGHSVRAHSAQRTGKYGAIALSARDKQFSWSYGAASIAEAEEWAVSSLDAPDAEIIGWACDAFLAMAEPEGVGGQFGFSGGYTREAAEKGALANSSGSNPQIRLSFHTRLNQANRG